jgi:hypothetical protein
MLHHLTPFRAIGTMNPYKKNKKKTRSLRKKGGKVGGYNPQVPESLWGKKVMKVQP